MKKESFIDIKVSNEDIYQKILDIEVVQDKATKIQDETLAQVKYTN